jgi:hypothetical protein
MSSGQRSALIAIEWLHLWAQWIGTPRTLEARMSANVILG